MLANASSSAGSLPSREEAAAFSVESVHDPHPVGLHDAARWGPATAGDEGDGPGGTNARQLAGLLEGAAFFSGKVSFVTAAAAAVLGGVPGGKAAAAKRLVEEAEAEAAARRQLEQAQVLWNGRAALGMVLPRECICGGTVSVKGAGEKCGYG